MNHLRRVTAWAPLGCLLLWAATAQASGPSPYAPLNLSPWIERRIDRVMILADRPILTRPISVEKVMQALPVACRRDHRLCAEVRAYMERYFARAGISYASGEVAAGSNDALTLPNERGQTVHTPLAGALQAYMRPIEGILLSAGVQGYGWTPHSRLTAEGTSVSVGNEYLQLDVGERPHWLSPMSDSSALISTESPTLPSITLSNQEPLGFLGFEYEMYLARMGYSSDIVLSTSSTAGTILTAGYPRLVGAHLGLNPLPGWALGANSEWQFGGGSRPGTLGDFFRNILKRTSIDTATGAVTRFANRTVSLTSAYTLPTRTPLEAYMELAFRDTLHESYIKPHISDTSYGLHLPVLLTHYDVTAEWSEWQEGWYQDYTYLDGLTNDGLPLGQWGADWRSLVLPSSQASGATSAMLRVMRGFESGRDVTLTLRTVQNANYGANSTSTPNLKRAYLATFEFSEPTKNFRRTWELDLGRDVEGGNFARIAAQLHLGEGTVSGSAAEDEDDSPDEPNDAATTARFARFVDVGAEYGKLSLDYLGFTAADEARAKLVSTVASPDFGVGVRRRVSEHSDIGVRLDLSDMHGLTVGFRVLDWRYRLDRDWALGSFVGVARYSAPTPAQGYYFGAGMQRRNVLPGWDVGVEYRYYFELQRDKLLPADQALAAAQHNIDPAEAYSAGVVALSLSRRF